ncbi:MAG: MASE1 domain-containing protein [Hyphomonadaceae bacterium]|nr:MASE1 domain-containing protein [Hyphomonadaceae bacterium]
MGAAKPATGSIIRALIYALLFVAAMEAAISVARFGAPVTPIWIASAILAWALITAPTRDWIVILAFAVAAHIIRAVLVGDKPATEAIYLLANIGGPLACASLMRLQESTLDFEDRSSVVRFLLSCGIMAPALSTCIIGLGTLVDPGRFRAQDLGAWFLSDALSYVVFLPVFKNLVSGGWRDLMAPALRIKTLLLFGTLMASLAALWLMPQAVRLPFQFLLIPGLVFLVFELGMTGARAAIIVSTFGFLLHALLAPEAARSGLTSGEFIFATQIYLAAMAACILPLAAALGEKQSLYEAASESLADAQTAWADLIAAEAHYRLVADNSRDMVMRVGLSGAVIFCSPACHILSGDVQALEGRRFSELVHPDDSQRIEAELAAFVKADMLDLPQTLRARLKLANGDWRAFDIVATLVASRGRDAEEIIAVLRDVHA